MFPALKKLSSLLHENSIAYRFRYGVDDPNITIPTYHVRSAA